MTAAKIHLLVTIVVQTLVCLKDPVSTLPYFPIEISRIAASSRVGKFVFQVGVATLIFTLLLSSEFNGTTLFLYFALMLIAYFDDVNNWGLHMLGVGLLFLVGVYHLYNEGSSVLRPILVATLIYFTRLLVKMVVMCDCTQYHLFLIDSEFRSSIFRQALQIMYHGSSDPVIITTFKLCGVLQWLSFYVFSTAF